MHKPWRTSEQTRTATVLLIATLFASLALVVLPGAAARAETCTELVANGGFETTGGWQLGATAVPPQYVTYTAHSGARSLQLGITSGGNLQSFSSARQTVAIPAGASQVTLSFWFYAIAEAPTTGDYMELVLLNADGSVVLAKPWRSSNDSRLWNQMAFDLSAWQGQTIQLYFNVYNDGTGGRSAMFLDDVSLTTCPLTPTVTVTPPSVTPGPTSTPTFTPPSVTPSPTPGCTDLVRNGSFSSGLGDWETVGDPSGVGLSTDPYHSPPYALKLGSLDITLNGLAAARQLVTIPAGSPVVDLEVWIYTQSQPGAGADYQEIALLNSSGGLLYVPYRGPANDNAWVRLQFNLAAFAGQTVYLRFAVNNDGVGGRTVMYVDDVRMTACSSGPVPTPTMTLPPPTATWTPAATPTWTPIPFFTWTPSPTSYPLPPTPPVVLTPLPAGCAELVQNGNFDAALAGWVPGANPLLPAIVTGPVLSPPYAVQLGTQTQNLNSYSSIRQTVTVPWGYSRTFVSFWGYTWSQSSAGQDAQEFVLLGPGNVVWAVPWKVLENNQIWQQHIYELVGVGGQTFDLYFAAINDGTGGTTALYVDDVHLWGCGGEASPFVTSAEPQAGEQAAQAAVQAPQAEAEMVPVPQVYPVETLPALDQTTQEPLVGAATEAVTATLPLPNWTEIAIATAIPLAAPEARNADAGSPGIKNRHPGSLRRSASRTRDSYDEHAYRRDFVDASAGPFPRHQHRELARQLAEDTHRDHHPAPGGRGRRLAGQPPEPVRAWSARPQTPATVRPRRRTVVCNKAAKGSNLWIGRFIEMRAALKR